MKTLVLLLAIVFSSRSIGQEVGSAQAARFLADAQNRAIEEQAAWNAAKKLSQYKKPNLAGETTLDLEQIDKGKFGRLTKRILQVISVVDKNSFIAKSGNATFWIEGFPTDSIVSDQRFVFLDYLEVTGTKDYVAVSGAKRTLWVLRALSESDAQKYLEQEKLAIAEQEKSKERSVRKWTSKNGSEINAKFVKFKFPKVELISENDKTIELNINTLSKEDAELVRKLAREDRQSK